MALAFSGSGPTVQNAGFYQNKSAGSTPQGNALNQAQTGIPFVHAPATPSTPVKSVTTTDPQGNTKAVTYHAQATPQTGTNPGMITPTTNADGSFTASDGSFHAANSPEAQNNKTMGSNATPPVQTPPPAPTGTPFSNTVNAGVGASANSYGQGTNNVNSGTGMTMNAVNNPNPNISTAQNGLLDIAKNQTPEVKNAQGEFANFSKANPYLVGNVGNNVAAEVASGRGQILGNELGKEQEALAQNVQNALQGQGQQITAGTAGGGQALTQQGQAITAGGQVANTGTTQQGAGITGLGTQATLIKPSPTAQGQTTYDPATNSFSGGSYQDNLSTVVQAIKDGHMGYTNGVDSLSGLSPTAKADVLKALGPGFDTVTSDAQATAKGGNVGTAGTATVNANRDVYNQAVKDQADTQAAVQNVDGLGAILMDSSQNGGINPTDINIINKKWADIKGQFSSATQAKFDTTLMALQSRISALLSSGSPLIPSAATADAKSIVNGDASLKTIAQTLDRIKEEGATLLKTQESKKNEAYQNMQGGSSSGSSGSSYTSNSGKTYSNVPQ